MTLTKQEMLNRNWQYFIVEGHAFSIRNPEQLPPAGSDEAIGVIPDCSYRNSAGDRCAIGCLIEDPALLDILAKKVDSISYLTTKPVPVPGLIEVVGHDIGFLSDLQRAHDQCAILEYKDNLDHAEGLRSYAERLRGLAEGYGLTVPHA